MVEEEEKEEEGEEGAEVVEEEEKEEGEEGEGRRGGGGEEKGKETVTVLSEFAIAIPRRFQVSPGLLRYPVVPFLDISTVVFLLNRGSTVA